MNEISRRAQSHQPRSTTVVLLLCGVIYWSGSLYSDICEKNLEFISFRIHIHMACSKDHERTVVEVSLSPPARSAGGDGRTVVISLPLLFYYLIPLLSLPPSSIQKYFLMDLESISKGYRQSKSYFEGTHTISVQNYICMCLFLFRNNPRACRIAQVLVFKGAVSQATLWFELAQSTASYY